MLSAQYILISLMRDICSLQEFYFMIRISRLLLILLLALPVRSQAATPAVPEVWTAPQAVAFALRNSPDSQVAAARIAEAEALLAQAQVGNYPQLTLNGGYTQTDNPLYSFGNILNQGAYTSEIDFNDPGRTDNLNLTTSLRYRLYNGGRDPARQNAAAAGIEAAQAAETQVRARLSFAVFSAFQHLIDSANLVKARQAGLDAIRSSLEVARARHEAGDLLKLDLLNLEVQESRALENHIQARHDQQLAQKIFLQLLGLTDRPVQISLQSQGPLRPQTPTIAARPELQQVAAALRAGEAELRLAQAGHLPTVDSFASYQFDRGFETGGDGNSWMAGVKVNFPLFDGYKTRSEIATAAARLARLQAEKRKLKLALNLELTRTQLALDQAEERRRVTRKMVEQASKSESLSQAQFKTGTLLASDLIDSENRLTDARVRHQLAASAVQIAIADLRRATGLAIFPHIETLANSAEQ